MNIDGLSDLQKDLLSASKQSDKAFKTVMRKVGSKARTKVARRARREVKKDTGLYHKKWKRGKVFVDPAGDTAVRVFNSSPHAHLIEDGHAQVVNPPKPNGRGVIPGKGIGTEVGFVRGKKVMKRAMSEFESSGEQTKEISKAIDDLLSKNKL